MPIPLYMDAHIPRVITLGLRMRRVDVLTAREDVAETLPDPELLDRATQLGRAMFTFDDDLLGEYCGTLRPY
jgi:predicted nuclease of predicted toxin-antitoxin system